MKILYYTWNEITGADIEDTFQRMHIEYTKVSWEIQNLLEDEIFRKNLENQLREEIYDYIFTFNFFPIISKVAAELKVRYISWIYDSPHLVLYTRTALNENNYIFHFDRAEMEKLKAHGMKHIFHMPLAVNSVRLSKIDVNRTKKYDISFLGTLYNNDYNFFDQVKALPEYYKGYFDALIQSQMKLFGYDLIADVITEKEYWKLSSFIKFERMPEMFLSGREKLIHIIHKKITVVEREKILRSVSNSFHTTLFSDATSNSLRQVEYKGYLNYINEMPLAFQNSKINLNITLRSILSGIPLRALDIMGAGGFLLSNYQPELAEFFENGTDMVMYESEGDLMTKIDYYLNHEEERNTIAQNGMRKVREEFSYEKRIKEMFELIGGRRYDGK